MNDKKPEREYLKYGRKYENTRREWLGRKSMGLKFTKEYVDGPEGKEIKWNVRQNNFQEFNSRHTFFPLYDTDNNSFIRLYRLHVAYKNKIKESSTTKEAKKNVVDRKTFRKCILLMNEQLLEDLLKNPEPLKIGNDSLECYMTAGVKKIGARRLPVKMLWTVHNPHHKKTNEYFMFPERQQFFGRLTFKQIKKRFRGMREDPEFLLKYPGYRETYTKKKYNNRDKGLFKEINDKDLSFNMFDDF